MKHAPPRLMAILALGALAACAVREEEAPGPLAEPPVLDENGGICQSRAITPAVIETVTEQVVVQPAIVETDGTVRSPAIFRTVTRQEIVRERREVEFETPCPDNLTPELIASVQRALRTRGYYTGRINGELDARTGRALQKYQRAQGDVDTSTLTMRSLRDLGLLALTLEELEAG